MDEIVTKEDVSGLVETIMKIPSLGTVGIVAAIILLVMLVGVWFYVKRLHIKHARKKNTEQRAKDQAENKRENQEISEEWREASERVEAIRQNQESNTEPKKERPKEPGGST